MFLGSALPICRDLVVLPYEFEKYDICSKALYRIIINNSDYVQAVSCDEAYIDVTFIIQKKLNEFFNNNNNNNNNNTNNNDNNKNNNNDDDNNSTNNNTNNNDNNNHNANNNNKNNNNNN